MTLYQLTDQLSMLLEMMEDPDVDADAVLDTADAIEMDFNDKADGYAKIIGAVNADVEAVDTELKRLAARKAAMVNKVARLKAHLQKSMELVGKTKFKTALFSFGIQNNAPSVVLEEDDPYKLPEEFIRYRVPEIDKKAIAEALKRGDDLTGIAHFEQGRSLRIR